MTVMVDSRKLSNLTILDLIVDQA